MLRFHNLDAYNQKEETGSIPLFAATILPFDDILMLGSDPLENGTQDSSNV